MVETREVGSFRHEIIGHRPSESESYYLGSASRSGYKLIKILGRVGVKPIRYFLIESKLILLNFYLVMK